MNDEEGVVESYYAVDGVLSPVSGEKLARIRAATKDMSDLFDPDNVKKSTPEEFIDKATGVVIKANIRALRDKAAAEDKDDQ